MVQAIFSTQSQKNETKKPKKKLKEKNKSVKSMPKTEENPEHRSSVDTRKHSNEGSQKSVKEVKEIQIEEKKIDLSVKPVVKPTSFSATKPKLEDTVLKDEQKVSSDKPPQNPISKHKSEAKPNGFKRNKRFNNEESKEPQIPHEAVSSFYQWDDGYSAKPFVKHHSQNYNRTYTQDLSG